MNNCTEFSKEFATLKKNTMGLLCSCDSENLCAETKKTFLVNLKFSRPWSMVYNDGLRAVRRKGRWAVKCCHSFLFQGFVYTKMALNKIEGFNYYKCLFNDIKNGEQYCSLSSMRLSNICTSGVFTLRSKFTRIHELPASSTNSKM